LPLNLNLAVVSLSLFFLYCLSFSFSIALFLLQARGICGVLCACVWVDLSSTAPHITQGENKGARCRNFVAPIFHLAWQKRVRFSHLHVPRGASIRLPKKNFSSVCHQFWKFIEGASASFRDIFWRHDRAKKSNSRKSCPFALLWCPLDGVRRKGLFYVIVRKRKEAPVWTMEAPRVDKPRVSIK